MRKNLLTLMLGFSFLLVGATITKAEVPNTLTVVPTSVVEEGITDKKLSLLKGNLSFLKRVCTPFDSCDNALLAANLAFALAVTTCDSQGWGSSACTSSLGVAERSINVAAEQCNVSTNIRKNIPIFSKENISKKRENAAS